MTVRTNLKFEVKIDCASDAQLLRKITRPYFKKNVEIG